LLNRFGLGQGLSDPGGSEQKGEKTDQTGLSEDELERHYRQFVAVVAAEYAGRGCIDCFILPSFDGASSQGKIASGLMARFPNHFGAWQIALRRIGDLSQRFSHGLE
jgi:hypothetical protein